MARKRKYQSEDEDEEEEDDFIAHSDEEEAAASEEEDVASEASESEEEEIKPRAKRARKTKEATHVATVPIFDTPAMTNDFAFGAPQPIISQPLIIPTMPILQPTSAIEEEDELDTPYCECGEPTLCKTIEKKGRNQGMNCEL